MKGGDERQTSRALTKPYEHEGRGHATNLQGLRHTLRARKKDSFSWREGTSARREGTRLWGAHTKLSEHEREGTRDKPLAQRPLRLRCIYNLG